MKITKLPLTEAVEEINPANKIATISDEVQAQVEAGEGELSISEPNAEKVAQEIAQVGDEVDAAEAIVLADAMLEKFSHDSIDEMKVNYSNYLSRIAER